MTWAAVGVGVGTAVFGADQANDAAGTARAANDTAAVAAAARRDQIYRATGLISAIFDSPERQAQYDQYAESLRTTLQSRLDREHEDTARQLEFSLARGGQTGGSVGADLGGRLADEYSEGVTNVERRVQEGSSRLREADEATRINLLNSAYQGMDSTQVARRADALSVSNLGTNAYESIADEVGSAFDSTTSQIRTNRDREGYRRGLGYDVFKQDVYGGAN